MDKFSCVLCRSQTSVIRSFPDNAVTMQWVNANDALFRAQLNADQRMGFLFQVKAKQVNFTSRRR